MTDICTHLDQILVTDMPASVDGCEDCLRIGGKWLHLRICRVATSAAAMTRRTATRERTHRTRSIRSSARSSRAKTGAGATSTRSGFASTGSTAPPTFRLRRCCSDE